MATATLPVPRKQLLIVALALLACAAFLLLVKRVSDIRSDQLHQLLRTLPNAPCNGTGWKELNGYAKNLETVEYHDLEIIHSDVHPGGYWHPPQCKPSDSVAVIVPFRDRASHLRILMHNLHAFLKSQQLEYQVFVIEQVPEQTFNRGKLMNVGFVEAFPNYNSSLNGKFTCAVFHDVDLIPEGPGPFYGCDEEQPKLLAMKQSQFDYKLPYEGYMGGVVAMTESELTKINGFSNDYWGWGGEDDDVANRIKSAGYTNYTPATPIGRYHMITHKKYEGQTVNPCRFQLLKNTGNRSSHDGLNSLTYVRKDRKDFHLYTWILVDLREQESAARLHGEGLCVKS